MDTKESIVLAKLASVNQKLLNQGKVVLDIKVIAKASVTAVKEVMADGTIKIAVAAVKERGLANQALIKFLADYFKVVKTNIKIISGLTGSKKMVKIEL